MHVYFNQIRYKEKPLLWKVNEEHNTATCMYQWNAKEDVLDSKKVNDGLSRIKGIDVRESLAIISDFKAFQQTHAPIEATKIRRSLSATHIRAPQTLFSSDSSKPLLIRTVSTPRYPSPKAKDSLFESITNAYKGETTCYFQLAESNKSRIANLRKYGALTRIQISIMEQVLKDEYFHPFRVQQLFILKDIFNKYLEPALSGLDKKIKMPQAVKPYLENAVIQILRNHPLNNQPSFFDVPAPISQHNPNFVLARAYEQKLHTASFMLIALEFFIKDDLAAEELVNEDNELALWLEKLKVSLAPVKQELSKLLLTLKLLTICSGIISYKNSLIRVDDYWEGSVYDIKKLISELAALKSEDSLFNFVLDKLKGDNAQVAGTILKELQENKGQLFLNTCYYSLSELLNKVLEKIYNTEKLKVRTLANAKNEFSQLMINELQQITKGNQRCIEAKYIPTVNNDTQDVYLREDWKNELLEHLAPQLLKYEKKKENSIQTKIHKHLKEEIGSFFRKKITCLLHEEETNREKEEKTLERSRV